MRILYVCSDLGIPVLGQRGGSIHVRSLVAALARAGHSVVVASPLLTKSPWEPPAALGVPVVVVEPNGHTAAASRSLKEFEASVGATPSLAGELRRILYNDELASTLKRRFGHAAPDIVFERGSLYGTVGLTVATTFGVPLLLEINAPLSLEDRAYRGGAGFGELGLAAERLILSRADAVLVVSSPLRDHVVSLGASPGRVHVLPNGVDPDVFRPGPRSTAMRSRWNLDGGPVIGFVGGLQPWHGAHLLPALLERLLPRHPGLGLVIVGDGPGRTELEREIRSRGVASSTRLTGSLPHEAVPDLIREFDLAVAPYPPPEHDFYFSPLKLFEYMACGVPVVAPRLGQIEEIVRHGETGLLYSASEPGGLAEACDRVLSDPELGRRLGSAAAGTVRDIYTWDHNAARIGAIAQELLAARRSTA